MLSVFRLQAHPLHPACLFGVVVAKHGRELDIVWTWIRQGRTGHGVWIGLERNSGYGRNTAEIWTGHVGLTGRGQDMTGHGGWRYE